jgi:phosphate uptake regulator
MQGWDVVERRIMSLGRSSMVISLPKNWMQLNELNKGDVISFAIQRDRSLVVYPSSKKKTDKKEITIHVGPNDEEALISRRIVGCYLNGYYGITLISQNIFSIPQRKWIRNIAGMLYMRIMESDAKGIYMQALIDESKASLEQAIERMHLISQSMCEEVFTALKNNNLELAKSVFSMDEDVDRFTFFILRLLRNAAQNSVLANELRVDPLDCMDHETLVDSMEHAAHCAADLAKHIIMLYGTKEEIPADIRELMNFAGALAIDMYAKAIATFFSKDDQAAVEILKNQQKVELLDEDIASKAFTGKQKDARLVCAICSIRDNIKRIADSAADIAKISINRAFKAAT